MKDRTGIIGTSAVRYGGKAPESNDNAKLQYGKQ
jgi:hypothetical protein